MKKYNPFQAITFLFFLLLLLPSTVFSQQLYVGANYHPHDLTVTEWKRDIPLMKAAGMNVVRMGHLAWDSYEPVEGKFAFAWFDSVMDMMHEAGIKVILDIAIRPAPIWLHQKYPSIDIVDASGNRLYPNHRYMDDVGDPNYQKYALRYADSLSRHYAKHPALLAFGIDNEPGDGRISYSETARARFVGWLKKKYTNVDNLNKAWATQRWSRRINDFEEVGFPVAHYTHDVPERTLDFRRFVSDETSQFLLQVLDKVNRNAPNVLTNTNAWYYSQTKYFDYAPIAYSGKMKRGGAGFYPGNSLKNNWGVMDALFGIARIQYEGSEPFWCNEFTTMTAVPNSIRKSAYATLMYGNQMVCGWTWQSMHAGEEQYLQGMMDWDGVTNRKYEEYKKIAAEFRKIEKFFPYKLNAETGLAFSFASQIASNDFPEQHQHQVQTCFNLFLNRNMDVRIIDLSRSTLAYKLVIIPGMTVMDEATATKVREFVRKGGTAIMTSHSAVVDESGQVFATTRPGLLADVFGIRVGGFEETESMNELSTSLAGRKIELKYKGKTISSESSRFDLIDLRGADVIGTLSSLDKNYPAITSHNFGKGRAIYIGLPAKEEILGPLVDDLIAELSMKKGPDVPPGVMARQVDEKHLLYLNPTGQSQSIKTKKARSLLFDRDYTDSFTLEPFEPDFIEIR
jgi:beta-galactosidase